MSSMTTPSALTNVHRGLELVRELRTSAAGVVRRLQDGDQTSDDGSKDASSSFTTSLKSSLDSMDKNLSSMTTLMSSTSGWPPAPQLPLGPSVYLSMDADAHETHDVYTRLVDSYRWLEASHEYAGHAVSLLNANRLTRFSAKHPKQKRRLNQACHALPPQQFDKFLQSTIGRNYADLSYVVRRPNNTKLHAIVEVTLDRLLRAVIVFKGVMIDWVVIRGFNEESGDVWTESRYQVFRRITENANAAMINFHSIEYLEVATRSFFAYIHSFNTLFTAKCCRCEKHLRNNLPPTWREYRTFNPYHEDCKP